MPSLVRSIFEQVIFDHAWSRQDLDFWMQNLISSSLLWRAPKLQISWNSWKQFVILCS